MAMKLFVEAIVQLCGLFMRRKTSLGTTCNRLSIMEGQSWVTTLERLGTVHGLVELKSTYMPFIGKFLIDAIECKRSSAHRNHSHIASAFPVAQSAQLDVYTMASLVAAISRASTSAVRRANAFFDPSGLAT